MNRLAIQMTVCLLFVASSGQACLADTFTWQAKIKQGGTTFNGTVDINASVFDVPAGGVALDTNSFPGVAVTDGLVTLELTFAPGTFDGSDRWLEIEAGGNILSPRQPVRPAPYALFALNAVDPEVTGTLVYPHGAAGLGPLMAVEFLDQDNSGITGLFTNVDSSGVWQSFTAGITGPLTSIAPSILTPTDGTLNVYTGTGTGGTLLASTAFVLGSGSSNIPLPTPVDVDAGSVYTIELVATGSIIRWYGNTGNPYPAGESTFGPDIDYKFQTFVTLDRGGVLVQQNGDVNILGKLAIARPAAYFPIHIGSDSTDGNGAHLTNGGMWTNGSDRNSKTNIEAVEPQDVLDKVLALPVTTWKYHGEPDSIRHIGPMAQDFYTTFGLGASDKHIGTIDADGVALVAIQALQENINEKDAAIAELTREVETLRIKNDALDSRLAQLELLLLNQ